ncbi:MAG TPA: 3-hydroxybutyrate oligomer hydrolase family protein [Candidatus Saccharimonadales bacterium]|nr:3-hydroxybutyrate oligomer hydrolase family protein [Candidatus Saccharimonadales bacterium]
MRGRLYCIGVMLTMLLPIVGQAETGCQAIVKALGNTATDVVCFDSTDLTTNNPSTTPANNSLAGWPPLAFTPVTDRGVISPAPPNQTTITKVVPGIQVEGYFADDLTHEARFVLRFPNDWNGKLVMAGASGTRSEYNGDFAWSDYVLQKGYAYASQNKGVLNLRLSDATDPLGCRLNPSSTTFVHFYDNDPAKPFTVWTQYILEATVLAKKAVQHHYGKQAKYTYVVGTSNGGYQVRRALETAPELYDGGVDWEGTFVDPRGPNILIDLPAVLANFPAYVASGYDPNSQAAKNIEAAGYPPDITIPVGSATASMWGNYNASFWEVTMCQWQKRLDPTYDTYVAGLANYNYFQRVFATHGQVFKNLAQIATTGEIGKPLITVAGTMDALLPLDRDARQYEERVLEQKHHPAYRLYEVQNGNHIDAYAAQFPQLETIQPHALQAFDLMVNHVENDMPLPESQCVPRGGTISTTPAVVGHCTSLFVP